MKVKLSEFSLSWCIVSFPVFMTALVNGEITVATIKCFLVTMQNTTAFRNYPVMLLN